MAGTRRRKARQATATAGKDVADATGSATPAAIPAPDEPVPRAQGIHNWLDAAVAVALLAPTAYMWTKIRTTDVRSELAWGLALSVAVFGVVVFFIPLFAERTRKAGLWGKDLCKRGTVRENVKVPEALGIVCGVVFIAFIIVGQLVFAENPESLARHNAAMLSVTFMVTLGFADDVMDLRWRYKLVLPAVASLPLLCSYGGLTSVVMPKPLRGLVMALDESPLGPLVGMLVTIDAQSSGAIIDLGLVYYLYMLLLAVFCTNSINIYAGINGLEAGQTFVIGCFVLFTNVLELVRVNPGTDHPHLFSALLLGPFVAAVLGLLKYNWFPSQVFVGDTFCYFSGMTLAVAGILGHYSKTLMLFFLPQILNFLYSLPQLTKVWPCPRHRLPRFDVATGLLYPSQFVDKNGQKRDNLTLICLMLGVFGPMKEKTLTRVLLGFQILCGVFAVLLRYRLAGLVYDVIE